jgi:hypothetical protein
MARLSALLLLLLLPAIALAASGIKGRVAWRGELCAGVRIRAYHSVADIADEKAVAVSAPTRADGNYQLELPPGSYYLTARDFDGSPFPGKLFCYYSGAPAQVRNGAFTNVGFNMIRIPEEAPPAATSGSGIAGEITYQGKKLEHCYLYVYQDGKDGFKGPGYVIQPVEKGTFRLRLPPGSYYLLARKRLHGGQFGPIETGDHFNFYYDNPVRIEAGKTREIKLETITKLSLFDAEEKTAFRGIRGTITGPDGKPAKGLHVFAYRDPAMTGTPDFFSPASGPQGRFELALPEGIGPYYLLAREAFGGPAAADELYGKYEERGGHAVSLPENIGIREIEIRVKKNLHAGE